MYWFRWLLLNATCSSSLVVLFNVCHGCKSNFLTCGCVHDKVHTWHIHYCCYVTRVTAARSHTQNGSEVIKSIINRVRNS